MYFTVDHENAILKFCTSQDRAEKEKLYIDFIQPAFNQMVDKIVFSYKFTNLPNIDELRDEWDKLVLLYEKKDKEKLREGMISNRMNFPLMMMMGLEI